jgi:hypothetical protein
MWGCGVVVVLVVAKARFVRIAETDEGVMTGYWKGG